VVKFISFFFQFYRFLLLLCKLLMLFLESLIGFLLLPPQLIHPYSPNPLVEAQVLTDVIKRAYDLEGKLKC